MQHAPFITGKINKHLVNLTLPNLWAILANLSFVLVDTYFLSLLGTDCLAAISFIFPVIAALQMVALGFGIATSSILSRRLGAGELQQVKTFIITIVTFAFFISVLISIIGFFTIDPLFSALGANPSILPKIHSFMRIWYFSLFFIFMSFIFNSVLRVFSRARIAGRIQVLGAILNAALSPFFIFTLHGGMAGSASANLIVRLLAFIVTTQLIFKTTQLSFDRTLWLPIKKQFSYWKEIIAISFPALLTNAIGPLSSIWMVHLLARYGEKIVAGFGIASRIEQIAVIPLFALSGSIGPIIGQNLGAKLYDRSYLTLKKSYRFSIFWGLFTAVLLYLIGHQLVSFFSADPTIIRITTLYLAIIPISYASWGVIMMTSANFNSIGKPTRSTMITIIRLVAIFIPLSLCLGHFFGYVGIFIALGLATILSSFIAGLMGIINWRQIDEYR